MSMGNFKNMQLLVTAHLGMPASLWPQVLRRSSCPNPRERASSCSRCSGSDIWREGEHTQEEFVQYP